VISDVDSALQRCCFVNVGRVQLASDSLSENFPLEAEFFLLTCIANRSLTGHGRGVMKSRARLTVK